MKKSELKLSFVFLIVLFVIFNWAENSLADTHTAASCSQIDVQAAIDLAISEDEVRVPAGECAWESDVTIPDDKKIILQGAGRDSTIISNLLPTAVYLKMGDSASRLTGFTFNEIFIQLFSGDARIDHNKFYTEDTSPGSGVYFNTGRSVLYEAPQALIDNNIFENCRVVVSAAGNILANKPWTLPLDLGGKDNTVYVEDNEFYRTYTTAANVMDANYGGAYVFRYNLVQGVNAYLNVQAHSVQAANRATRKWECYGNIIRMDNATWNTPFFLRAGTGVIFYNSLVGEWRNNGLGVDNVRSVSTIEGEVGKCNGLSSWDGNEDATGYPCRDQIGRGPDAVLWSNSPVGAYTQPLLPAYGWINKNETDIEIPFRVLDEESEQHIKADRDFYDFKASFDGTSGMGAGTLANRPVTCTTNVAYWATDQVTNNITEMVGVDPATPISGTLYKCTATNTWTVYYEPYVYPHPLRTSGSFADDSTPPAIDEDNDEDDEVDKGSKNYKLYKKYKIKYKNESSKEAYIEVKALKKYNFQAFAEMKALYQKYKSWSNRERNAYFWADWKEMFGQYKKYNGYRNYKIYKDKVGL